MVKMITESNYSIEINESQDKTLHIQGIFASAEKKNQNGRVYPKKVLKREVDKIQESINNKNLLGEMNHPTDRAETDLSKATILIENLEWKDNDVYGKAKVLSTPYGQIARSLIQDGVCVGISSRGLGTVNESGYVNEDYKLVSWDLVNQPSNYGSWVQGILEGKEFNLPTNGQSISYQDIKKFLSENNFNYDPMKVSELIKEGYELEYVKDMIVKAQDDHVKRIYQVLESIR